MQAMLRERGVGMMCQPGNYGPDTAADWQPWAADNGCFASTWSPDRWLDYLDRYAGTPGCLFAVVPDVVADADATRALWPQWVDAVTSRGFRPAYVLQDGEDGSGVPWSDEPAVFVGGSTAYKLGPARVPVAMAKERGLHVHMGRVNSLRRLRTAVDFGCDTADGTYLAFGPDVNVPRLCRMLDALNAGTQLSFALLPSTSSPEVTS